jgi:glycosyltransferase involved in cell wall biosynthesis
VVGPLLSVVVPTHNRPERLERAADSILSQALVEIELVIVDDASDDQTPDVLERLAVDPRVTVVRNERSLGPSGSRNRGIGVATGSLLGFCDDDDTWMPGAAAVLVGSLEADPELGVVTSWHRVIHDATGRAVDYRGPRHISAADLLWFNFVALPFGIVRRSHFPEGLSFDERLPPCEDWDLWLRCARARPMGVVPLGLYAYHQHGGERVTTEGSRWSGRQMFLDKYAASMSPACRIYHEAVIAQQAGGRKAMLAKLAASGVRRPAAAAFAGLMLSTSYEAAALGIRRGDPGLPARAMYQLLGHH